MKQTGLTAVPTRLNSTTSAFDKLLLNDEEGDAIDASQADERLPHKN
jgi:hypothetical protein